VSGKTDLGARLGHALTACIGVTGSVTVYRRSSEAVRRKTRIAQMKGGRGNLLAVREGFPDYQWMTR